MSMLKAAARRVAHALGVRIVRTGFENRFDASDAALRRMAARGYAPRIVIDCGANRGQWAEMASRVFPQARFHLIEPQRGCHDTLARFPAPRFTLHRVAVTAAGVQDVQMIGGGITESSTGAFVAPVHPTSSETVTYPATTLDALVAAQVTPADRALLKLDIEGHELEALQGATAVLSSVECVFCEVRFYDVHHGGISLFADVLAFLRDRDFELYDIAALSGRQLDGRLRLGDVIFVRLDSALAADVGI